MKICWFTTGRDEEALKLFQDVLSAMERGQIRGEVSLVFLNRERGEARFADLIMDEAERKKIPYEVLSSKRFFLKKDRETFDTLVVERIKKYQFDLIFLAGYMLILTPILLENYRIINIHPSLPRTYKGKWEDVIASVIENGDKFYGAMVHLVTEALDEGPALTYVKFKIEGMDDLYERVRKGEKEAWQALFRKIREKEFSLETPLIIKTLSLLSEGEIEVKERQIFYKGKEIQGGIDITSLL